MIVYGIASNGLQKIQNCNRTYFILDKIPFL